MLEWATSDPDFRVKLLRFVDVLPALRTRAAVADHVRQYFREGSPAPIRFGSAVAGTGAFRPVLSKVVRQGVFAMADRFIGGTGPRDALPRLRELQEAGTAYTIDLLGEATLSEREADAYLDRYLELVAELAADAQESAARADIRQPNVSVKLSALTSHFEPAAPTATEEAVLVRLHPLLRAARDAGVFLNIDMEQYRFKDLTHGIFERIALAPEFRDWPDLGIVVQAYLKDAEADVERLSRLARKRGTAITVRLVKGAYWDEEVIVAGQEGHPVPVWEEKDATDACFERCTSALIEAYPHLRVALGSHNPRSISQAIVKLEQAGVPQHHAEFQMLYGMAEGLRKAVQADGWRTRVYVPAGEIIPGMAYLVRRLLENTSNQSWLLHRHEEGDPADLLSRPVPSRARARKRPAHGFTNFATAEWHLPADREHMQEAVDRMRDRGAGTQLLSLAGKRVETGEWAEVRYPGDPALMLGRVARANAAHVEDAVTAARGAFDSWRSRAPAERAGILREAADRMAARRFELAALMVFESGKPWKEADGDLVEAVDFLRYYASEAERLGKGMPLVQVPGEVNAYRYEARGVAAIIAPWNFPLAIITGMTSAALAAGCPAILKPAEQSPLIASRLVDILHEAGVPGPVVQYLPGPGEVVGQALVTHPGVDVIAFTGSNAVGLGILREASVVRPGQRNVKRVVLEMGGKNAVIVDDDADLDQAVEGVVASAFGYAGQKCSAASRVIVVGSAYPEFRERLAAAVESLVAGPAHEPYTSVPPVVSAEARERIEGYIKLGRERATLVAAGPSHSPGHYVAPHVFEDVPVDSPLAREEIFGPVLCLFRADDFGAALRLALDSDFALTGGLYSRHPAHIARAIAEFRVGNLYVNRKITGAIVGRQPFGGVAMSGAGDKAGGPDYLLQFLTARTVTENTVRRGFAPERGT